MSKRIAEQWCAMYGQTYALPTRALRFFSVYGPGQVSQGASGVVAVFTHRALRNEPIMVMSNQRRDFTHVDDVVRGIIVALERVTPGFDVLNIATGIGTSFSTLAKIICQLTGSASAINESALERTSTHLVANVEHASEALDFRAQIQLLGGLESYCGWTRNAALRSP